MDWVHESLAMDTDHTENPVMCQEMYNGWTAIASLNPRASSRLRISIP